MPKGKGYGGDKGAKMPTKTGNRPASGSKKK